MNVYIHLCQLPGNPICSPISINIPFPLAFSMGGKKIIKIIKINTSDELNYYLKWSQLIEDVLFLSTAPDLISPTLAAASVFIFGRSSCAFISILCLYLAAWKLSMCMVMHAGGCKAYSAAYAICLPVMLYLQLMLQVMFIILSMVAFQHF